MAALPGFQISRFGLSVLTLALAVTVMVTGVSGVRGAQVGPSRSTSDPLPVETAIVALETTTQVQTLFPALFAARRESALGFETGGRIAEIGFDIGDRVEAGDSLARLDTRALEAQLSALMAQIDAAQARADLAQVTLERQRQLVDAGHISPQRLDEAEAETSAALAQQAALVAEARTVEVRLDLSEISAPYSGVIVARRFDEGAIAGPGVPVLELVEDGALELRVSLPLQEAAALVVGESYRVETAGHESTVIFRAATDVVDARRRAVTSIFDADQTAGATSGSVARLILNTELEASGFWAPLTALSQGRRGLWSIFILAPQDGAFILEPRPVEIIHTEGSRVYLTGSVREGEVFLATGVQRVVPGQAVRPAGEG